MLRPPDSIPFFEGGPILRHMRDFRCDRIGFLLRLARAHPDVARVRLGALAVLFTSSPEFVRSVLVEHADHLHKSVDLKIFSAPLLGDSLLRLEGDAHRTRRRMIAPIFTSKRISGYADEMALRAEASVERMRARPELDIAAEAMRVTLEIIGKTMFDAEVGGDAELVRGAADEAMRCIYDSMTSFIPLPPIIPTPSNFRLWRAVRQLDGILYRVIREHRASDVDRGDLLSVLLSSRDQDTETALHDRAVRDEAMTLFMAGHETTANNLAWTVYLLASHPDARDRLEAEVTAAAQYRRGARFGAADLPRLPWTLQVIKEALRLYPPAYIIARRVARSFEAEGHRFRRGDIVCVNIIGLHRRPDVFPNPERFDPERFRPDRERELPRHAFMPFGGGPRICIGNHFALMEAQLVLATWMHALRFELRSEAHPGFDPLLTLRPRHGIRVRVRTRHSSTEAL